MAPGPLKNAEEEAAAATADQQAALTLRRLLSASPASPSPMMATVPGSGTAAKDCEESTFRKGTVVGVAPSHIEVGVKNDGTLVVPVNLSRNTEPVTMSR